MRPEVCISPGYTYREERGGRGDRTRDSACKETHTHTLHLAPRWVVLTLPQVGCTETIIASTYKQVLQACV